MKQRIYIGEASLNNLYFAGIFCKEGFFGEREEII